MRTLSRNSITRRRSLIVAAMAAGLSIAAPSMALAHAVVYPKVSQPGAYEKYVLRVPNERDVPTIRVEIHFPAGLRVVSFSEVAGWKLTVLRDSAQRIIGAIWTGVLPKERFIEFPFIAVNPEDNSSLTWPTYQTYQGGERVDWTGPDSSKSPASSTVISAVPESASEASAASHASLYLSILALFLALIALGLVLRPVKVTEKAEY